MFDPLYTTYKKIISCLGIVGYLEEDIKKRGLNTKNNLPLNCLYAYPNIESTGLNSVLFQMMFPDNNHKIPCPKFFTLSLKNQQGTHSYMYCLKFSEKYSLTNDNEEIEEIDIPIVIFIKSEKHDLESFKELLNLINYIIINDDYEKDEYIKANNINDYKKVQLINLFYFIFSLPHTSPHSLVKLKLNKEIKTSPFETIDFYFSSNCEIPCNKNDTDINILFLILDQSIIIKVLFALLTEKQIILMASQAYLLHLLIPTFLKLLFPFKWLHTCITVLPKESLDLLEAPGTYIIGILSNEISSQDIMEKYPNKIIVDCDTNEIFGDNYFEPFNPPKNISAIAQFDEKEKKKSIKRGKDKDYINKGNHLTQGNNLFLIEDSYLYQYENEPNTKKTKLNFEEKNNIIIDTRYSQLLVDKSNIFIDRREWKWLRRNLQLVRNPEIFDLENIDAKNNLNKIYLNEEEEEKVILPNRPFSYNIQNILMNFILKKMNVKESAFMSIFTKTNLYLAYDDPNQYQNNAGKKIIKNISDISDLKMKERTINNCFNIEYTLQRFRAQQLLNIIDEKLSKNKNIDENMQNIYNKIKIILSNYNKIKIEEDPENINNYDLMYESERNEGGKISIGIKDYGEGRKTEMRKPFGRLTRKFTSHERNKTSVLQETFSGDNKFLLEGVDNSVKGVFKFYKVDGFLEFINFFDIFLKEENINIKEELYLNKINEQIFDIILNDDIFFNKKNNNNNNISKNNIYMKKDSFVEKDKKKKVQMSTIPEYEKEEEDNETYIDGRGTVIQDNAEDYDFTTNIIKNIKNMHLNLEDINDNKLNEEDIISFPSLNSGNDEINENNNNIINTNDENVNLKSQYYLFIALLLEDILPDKEKSEKLIEEIYKKNNNKINITSLLLKLYRLSYKYSGLNHRDFPYFSYYSFLSSFNLEELKSIKEELDDIAIDEIELYVIYGNVIMEKEKVLLRKNKNKTKNKDKKVSDSKEKKNDEKKKEKQRSFQFYQLYKR